MTGENSGTPIGHLGSILGEKYRITRQLGEGGMGAVFEAEHLFLKRRVAVKFLRNELLQDSGLVERFQREAQASGQLEHENITSAIDFGVTPGGAPYFVMEYLQGETLSRVIRREGPLTAPRAVSLIVQACRGVAAAHARGIVHRDLKPDNLFVCPREDGTEWVKVLDFGIAKIRIDSNTEGSNTKTGTTMGTPCYMSPEQARGDRNVDHRTDVYSLGAVLYEALGNVKPHGGITYNEIIYAILSRDPTPLSELCPKLPGDLVSIVERAMARDPSDRFSSMAAFASALGVHCGLRGGSAAVSRRVSPSRDVNTQTTPSPISLTPMRALPQPEESNVATPPSRARATRTIVVGLVAAASIFAVLLWRYTRADSGQGRPVNGGTIVTTSTSKGALPSATSDSTRATAPVSQPIPASSDSRALGSATQSASRTTPGQNAGATPAAQPTIGPKLPKSPGMTASPGSKPSASPSKYDRENPYE